jgi:hypothetical protein
MGLSRLETISSEEIARGLWSFDDFLIHSYSKGRAMMIKIIQYRSHWKLWLQPARHSTEPTGSTEQILLFSGITQGSEQ